MVIPSSRLKKLTYPVSSRELLALREGIDWLSPLEAYDRFHQPYHFLLESVAGTGRTAKYSLIGLLPSLIYESKNCISRISEKGETSFSAGNPFTELANIFKSYHVSGDSPFLGCMVGFLSYDMGRFVEKLPDLAVDDLKMPDCVFLVMEAYLWFDHQRKEASLIVLCDPENKAKASAKMDTIKKSLSLKPAKKPKNLKPLRQPDFISNFSKTDFKKMVEQAKEYIFAGDIYQVNLSQRLTTPISAPPLNIYKRLREINPSPFAAYFNFGDWQMVSCSPERLIKLVGYRAETRPIAGTIRRGVNGIEDQRLTADLIRDIKERAEHIMLVDLERNDLGRVAEYGSVRVDELMVTESYSHVTHIVSNVVGRLRSDKNQFDLLKACFPGGTITGCPKIRSMEIIEELEPVKRGPYTGSIGYFGFNNEMDFNIIIRTLIIKNGLAHIQAGAGIVADSIPVKEYYETMYKAEALIKATKLAESDE